MNTKFILLSLLVSTLALSACASGGTKTAAPANSINPNLKTAAINKSTEKTLAQAEASGNKQEVLAVLANIHRSNPKDPIVATRYARALAADDQINAAERTLEPFTKKGALRSVEAITEMAMTQLTLGNFKKAEAYAQQATELKPSNARAYLAMGTAQDALGRHQDAEISFREGLQKWQGDPAPIMNNLALNLASQGHLEESLAMIKKAQKLSPGRMELERNRRIISTLLETTGPRPPAPNKKPTAGENNDIEPAAAPAKMPAKKPVAAKKPEEKPKEEVKAVAAEKAEEVIKEVEEKTQEQVEPQAPIKSKIKNIKLKPLS